MSDSGANATPAPAPSHTIGSMAWSSYVRKANAVSSNSNSHSIRVEDGDDRYGRCIPNHFIAQRVLVIFVHQAPLPFFITTPSSLDCSCWCCRGPGSPFGWGDTKDGFVTETDRSTIESPENTISSTTEFCGNFWTYEALEKVPTLVSAFENFAKKALCQESVIFLQDVAR